MVLKNRFSIVFCFLLFISHFSGLKVLSAETGPDSVKIIHISDTHICNLENYHPALFQRRLHYGNGFATLEKFLDSIPAQINADAVAITGDLIDYFEGETGESSFLAGQIEYFAGIYDNRKIPLLLALGNHDIYSYWSGLIENKNASQLNAHKARAAWIRKIGIFNNGCYYFVDYPVGQKIYRLFFLDNAYRNGYGEPGPVWSKEQLDWLEHTLSNSGDRIALLFFHIPLVVGDTNNDGIHFATPPDGWPFANTFQKGIMKILNSSSSVKAIFVGHNHRNIIEDMPFPAGHNIVQIETAAFARSLQNWRQITLTQAAILVSGPEGIKIEKIIKVP